MEFSSLIFIYLFLPIFLFLFFVLKKDARHSFLLIASLVFYTWGEGRFVLLLLVSILINYILGVVVDSLESPRWKKSVFLLAVAFNLGMLIYFKYTHFILQNLGIPSSADAIHLPVGISFYTFQALSFIIDIYRKTIVMDRNPVHFALYISFFPKLVTGPITPYHNFSKQVIARQPISIDDISEGIKRFITGLGKKVLIADTLAVAANNVFAVPVHHQTAGLAWLGAISYTLQIYFDFSGYTDMAIGIGRMCGFKLPENFNYPYISKSVKEFWQRWHITLAHWLRDYLFLPIAYAVSRKIKNPRLLGIKAENWAYFIGASITFLLCGIWHGAAWTFFLWGAYYGILLIIEHAGLGKKMKRRWWKPFPLIYTQLMVMIGWVIFRSPSLSYAFSYLKTMCGFGSGSGKIYYASLYMNSEIIFFLVIGIIGSMPLVPWLKKWTEKRREHLVRNATIPTATMKIFNGTYNLLHTLIMTALLLVATMVLAGGTYNPFIYFRF